MFIDKTRILKDPKFSENSAAKMEILNQALKDLNLTEEPITDYYEVGEFIGNFLKIIQIFVGGRQSDCCNFNLQLITSFLGKGKFGVVREAKYLKNPEFRVAIKAIQLDKIKSL